MYLSPYTPSAVAAVVHVVVVPVTVGRVEVPFVRVVVTVGLTRLVVPAGADGLTINITDSFRYTDLCKQSFG